MELDFEKAIKDGVEQATRDCELTIGMTLKEAVEKQIPKTPKILKVHDILEYKYKYGECWCGEHIMDDEKYCSNCGQKLNWESDEE